MADNKYRVRLVSVLDELNRVEFKVTPTFSESRSVDYVAVTPIHMPGAIQVYKNSGSRSFSIGATLVSRTGVEAWENMYLLQTLRAWTVPYFGQKSSTLTQENRAARESIQQQLNANNNKAQSVTGPTEQKDAATQIRRAQGIELLGAPPMVLYLYAYSTAANDARPKEVYGQVNINRVPVVINNLEITYPEDVDYIPAWYSEPTENTEPFPVKMTVNISLVETHSPREYEQFSLADFYNGKLVNF